MHTLCMETRRKWRSEDDTVEKELQNITNGKSVIITENKNKRKRTHKKKPMMMTMSTTTKKNRRKGKQKVKLFFGMPCHGASWSVFSPCINFIFKHITSSSIPLLLNMNVGGMPKSSHKLTSSLLLLLLLSFSKLTTCQVLRKCNNNSIHNVRFNMRYKGTHSEKDIIYYILV